MNLNDQQPDQFVLKVSYDFLFDPFHQSWTFLLSSRKCRLLTVAPRKNLGLCPSSLHSAIESPRHPLDGCPHPNGAINDPKEKKEGKESYCIVGEGTKIGELPIS